MDRSNMMKNKYFYLVASILLFLYFLPCPALCESVSVGMQMGLKMESQFKISLEANPTTGYKWEVKFDKDFLKLKSDTFKKPANARVGQGGMQTFVFIPVKSGVTVINFLYKRPWEKKPVKEKRYKITITK
jgi:inhibitor of cysteine peptidase